MANRPGPHKISAKTVTEQVYDQLKALILDGHFSESYRFDLNDLSKELGVSRTPLSAAIHQLQKEGLLLVKPRAGTFLSPISQTEVVEAFELRRILETGAADAITENASKADLRKIEATHEAFKKLLNEGDYQGNISKLINLDKQLHEQFIEASGNALLIKTYQTVNTLLFVSRARQKYSREDSVQTVHEHGAIVEALKRRDRTALIAAFEAHLSSAVDRLVDTETKKSA